MRKNLRSNLKPVKSKSPDTERIMKELTDIENTPDGFRPVHISQAILEYAKPVIEFCEDDEEDMKGMEIAQAL